MTVLSSPNGNPERVWSLIAGLQALGGETDRKTFDALLNPGFLQDGRDLIAQTSLANDAMGAATSLCLIENRRDCISLGEGVDMNSFSEFADHVHKWLVSLESNHSESAILDAYAWVAAESDRQNGLGWIYDWNREEFAQRANESLDSDGSDGRLINATRLAPWRRWLSFLGLSTVNPISNQPDFPWPTERLAIEIEQSDLAKGNEVLAKDFIEFVSKRMPYLDRGKSFLQACRRIGHTPATTQLSPLMSCALRDLHDEGVLTLVVRGDATENLRLSSDPAHAIEGAFVSVKINARKAN